jgi:probable F420-dependent oxidoreductase
MTKEDVVSAAFIVAGGARAEALASHGKHTIAGRTTMEIGASIFFTEYSISPTELAPALEERGFDSLWVAEHSHIPVTRRFSPPGGGDELGRQYYDVMDPFVTLSAAAAVTKRLKLATGVCLVIQRDTIQTAKLVVSLDEVSGGRFIFGIGGGWNAEEMENHGTVYPTRFKKMREQIEAMKEIWTKDKAEYHGEIVDFPPMMTWPKPVQKPHPPIILGGAFQYAARRAIRYGNGLIPQAADARSGEPEEYLPRFRRMAEEAGRDARSLQVTLGGAPEDPDQLKRYRDIGIARMNVRLPAAKADEILPVLDHWSRLIRQVQA